MQSKLPVLLIAVVFGLLSLGIVMLSSASSFVIFENGDEHSFLRRQASALGIGAFLFCVVFAMDYRVLARFSWVFLILGMILLALCFIEPFAVRRNGASRWVDLQIPMLRSFQPSELAKISVIIFLAAWYQKAGKKAQSFLFGVFFPGIAVAAVTALVLFETDLGTAFLIAATSLILMFIGGARLVYLIPLSLLALALIGVVALGSQERKARLEAFFNPEAHAHAEGRQQEEGLTAIGSGGLTGVGLAKGRQKLFYIPYAHTDFIFTIIGEELGLVGTLAVVLGFLILGAVGTGIAMQAPDRFGLLLAMGATLIITLQALVNLGVTTKLLPNKGLPLPFISFGGSNLIASLILVGILLAVHRGGVKSRREVFTTILNARVTRRQARRFSA